MLAALISAGCARQSATAAGAGAGKESAPAITDGRTLVDAMARTYAGRWYRTLSFTQSNTLYASNNRERKSEWIQRIAIPGRLRIDYLPADTRSGVLYRDGKVYVFVEGRQQEARSGWNPTLVLSGDVYAQPPATTQRVLDSLHFDLSRVRRDTWEGRPVWITGAAAGDTTTNQFWVDASRMVLVRVIQTETQGGRTITSDTRFGKYVDVEGIPIAGEVLLYRDGRLTFREERSGIQVNATIDEAVFDPARWGGVSRR
jgi:hypothetical protein